MLLKQLSFKLSVAKSAMTIKTYPFNPMPSLKPLEMSEKSYIPEHFDAQHAVSPAFTSPSDRVVIFMRYEIWIVHVRLLAIFLLGSNRGINPDSPSPLPYHFLHDSYLSMHSINFFETLEFQSH